MSSPQVRPAVAPEPNKPAAGDADVWTVRRILEWTTGHLAKHGSDTPRLDSEILLAHARGCRRIELYTRFEEPLTDVQRTAMRDLVRRRAQHEPVAYLVGHREFYGLEFRVTHDVLIPRPDTETLVMELIEAAKADFDCGSMPKRPSTREALTTGDGAEVVSNAGASQPNGEGTSVAPVAEPRRPPRVLDLGTGTGCIAISVAVNCPTAEVTAIDLSEPALAVARENAERHRVTDRIRFLHGDLFAPLAAGKPFDLIASNPPYIGEAEFETLQPDVRLHEPKTALVSGADGLKDIRRLIAEAPEHLAPGGRLFLEIAPEQAEEVERLLQSEGAYADVCVIKDLAGNFRVATARRV